MKSHMTNRRRRKLPFDNSTALDSIADHIKALLRGLAHAFFAYQLCIMATPQNAQYGIVCGLVLLLREPPSPPLNSPQPSRLFSLRV